MSVGLLSRQDRRKGMMSYSRHIFCNEIGFTFVADFVIILLALKLGASNTQIGFIAAAMYAAGLVILLTPVLFGGLRLVGVFATLWELRGWCCLLYFAAVFMPDRFGHWRIFVLLTGYGLFAIFRNLAWPMKQALEKSLIIPSERGRSLAKISIIMNYGKLLASLLCFAVLSSGWFSEMRGLLLLCGSGIMLNIVSARILRKIPVRESIEPMNSAAFRTLSADIFRRDTLAAAILYCGGVSMIIPLSFVIPLLRDLGGVPVYMIFFYSLLTTTALICSGVLSRIFSDRIGNRPLLTVNAGAIAAAAAIMALIPVGKLPWGVIMACGVLLVFLLGVYTLLVSRLLLQCMPPENKLGFTSFLNFFAAIAALVTGFCCGKAADLGLFQVWGMRHLYSPVFVAMALLAVLLALCARLVLRDSGAMSIREAGRVFLCPDSLKTALLLDRLEESGGDRNRNRQKLIMVQLSMSASGLATGEIRRRLKSPLIRVKEDLLQSLFFYPRPELLEDIIAEAGDRDSWWREAAIFALGAYPGVRTERVLLDIYHQESYPYLRSIVTKSLGRIGNRELLPELREVLFSRDNLNIKTAINFIISISLMDKSCDYMAEFAKIANLRATVKFRQHFYVIFSRRLGCEPGIDHFFHLENISKGDGVDELLTEVIALPEFLEAMPRLKSAFDSGDYRDAAQWCADVLDPKDLPAGAFVRLRDGLSDIVNYPVVREDAMAVVFFSYILLCHLRDGKRGFNGSSY